MEWAPLSGIQPAELAKSRLKAILDQSVSFVAGPWPGRLHKNLWITLNSLLYSNGYRENHTEPAPGADTTTSCAFRTQMDTQGNRIKKYFKINILVF